jgi:hypothetical protein
MLEADTKGNKARGLIFDNDFYARYVFDITD